MTISMTSIAEWLTPARWAPAPFDSETTVSGWSIDSRTANPGDCFFALRGPANDGHDYIAGVTEKGARMAVVDHPVDAGIPQLVVPDTLRAMQQLAYTAGQH